jgi:hypothetical protein
MVASNPPRTKIVCVFPVFVSFCGSRSLAIDRTPLKGVLTTVYIKIIPKRGKGRPWTALVGAATQGGRLTRHTQEMEKLPNATALSFSVPYFHWRHEVQNMHINLRHSENECFLGNLLS